MKLYLVQHGDAVSKDIDPDRPLSAQGKVDVKRMANFLATRLRGVRVVHSGKTRALQTAGYLAEAVSDYPVEVLSGINPNDPVEPIARLLGGLDQDTMVVGHLPFMAKLVAQLIHGVDDVSFLEYQPGSVVCLEVVGPDKSCVMCWMLRPELLAV